MLTLLYLKCLVAFASLFSDIEYCCGNFLSYPDFFPFDKCFETYLDQAGLYFLFL